MKAVIIEDETLVAKQLERKIALIAADVQIMAILPSLKTARKWFMENAEPDLLFMDIQLSDGISFELFDYYQLSCPVIFTTAYDEYAIRAFKANGIDYLLKPVGEAELARAIDKCRLQHTKALAIPADMTRIIQLLTNPSAQQVVYKEKFIVSIGKQWVAIDTHEIACFGRDQLNYLHTYKAEKHVVDYDSMDDIEALLNPRQFFRANRQFIVSINAIQSIRLHENQKLTAILKAPLQIEVDISREKAPVFKKWFDR